MKNGLRRGITVALAASMFLTGCGGAIEKEKIGLQGNNGVVSDT